MREKARAPADLLESFRAKDGNAASKQQLSPDRNFARVDTRRFDFARRMQRLSAPSATCPTRRFAVAATSAPVGRSRAVARRGAFFARDAGRAPSGDWQGSSTPAAG